MKIGFRLLPRGIEENVFKAVPNGWVLSGAHPLLFGPSRSYFVTEAQKPAIAAKVRRKFYANIMMAVVGVELAMAAAVKYPWLFSATAKAAAVWGVLLVAFCVVSAVTEHLMMRPVVRDLPRSMQKVGMVDRLKRMSESMSTTSLSLFALFSAFCAAMNLYAALGEGRIVGWFGAPFMALLTIGYGYVLVLKLRRKPAVDAA